MTDKDREKIIKNNEWWKEREARAREKLSNKAAKKINDQMRKYYKTAMNNTINSFSDTYIHILDSLEDGREPTPADLYKLDTYWQMQGQLQGELQKLNAKQVKLLSENFRLNFFDVYHSIALEGLETFNTIDTNVVEQLINAIWCSDGKTWSSRIWDNTTQLAETLNEELINCLTTGKKTTELKKILQDRFSVSYGRADTLVRTELAHIQTEAAKKRYEDYGIKRVQIWADADERRCETCGDLHEKYYVLGEAIPIPAHPKCRCCIVPVVE